MVGRIMKRQTIYIPDYDWTVYVYYDTTPYNMQELLGKLHSLGCSEKGISRTYEQLFDGSYNNGLTYTNKALKRSILALGRASSFPQFLNSFVHEVHHLATHIAVIESLPLDGEEVCYLSGWIAQQMYPVLIHYISKCGA